MHSSSVNNDGTNNTNYNRINTPMTRTNRGFPNVNDPQWHPFTPGGMSYEASTPTALFPSLASYQHTATPRSVFKFSYDIVDNYNQHQQRQRQQGRRNDVHRLPRSPDSRGSFEDTTPISTYRNVKNNHPHNTTQLSRPPYQHQQQQGQQSQSTVRIDEIQTSDDDVIYHPMSPADHAAHNRFSYDNDGLHEIFNNNSSLQQPQQLPQNHNNINYPADDNTSAEYVYESYYTQTPRVTARQQNNFNHNHFNTSIINNNTNKKNQQNQNNNISPSQSHNSPSSINTSPHHQQYNGMPTTTTTTTTVSSYDLGDLPHDPNDTVGPCVLYTDIPFLTRFIRILGHVAVTNYERTKIFEIRAWPFFDSNNSVWILEGCNDLTRPILFGNPTRYYPLNIPPMLKEVYNFALEQTAIKWQNVVHHGILSNCHSFICDVLNTMYHLTGGTGFPFTFLRLGLNVFKDGVLIEKNRKNYSVIGRIKADFAKLFYSIIESGVGLHHKINPRARRQLNRFEGQNTLGIFHKIVEACVLQYYNIEELYTPTTLGIFWVPTTQDDNDNGGGNNNKKRNNRNKNKPSSQQNIINKILVSIINNDYNNYDLYQLLTAPNGDDGSGEGNTHNNNIHAVYLQILRFLENEQYYLFSNANNSTNNNNNNNNNSSVPPAGLQSPTGGRLPHQRGGGGNDDNHLQQPQPTQHTQHIKKQLELLKQAIQYSLYVQQNTGKVFDYTISEDGEPQFEHLQGKNPLFSPYRFIQQQQINQIEHDLGYNITNKQNCHQYDNNRYDVNTTTTKPTELFSPLKSTHGYVKSHFNQQPQQQHNDNINLHNQNIYHVAHVTSTIPFVTNNNNTNIADDGKTMQQRWSEFEAIAGDEGVEVVVKGNNNNNNNNPNPNINNNTQSQQQQQQQHYTSRQNSTNQLQNNNNNNNNVENTNSNDDNINIYFIHSPSRVQTNNPYIITPMDNTHQQHQKITQPTAASSSHNPYQPGTKQFHDFVQQQKRLAQTDKFPLIPHHQQQQPYNKHKLSVYKNQQQNGCSNNNSQYHHSRSDYTGIDPSLLSSGPTTRVYQVTEFIPSQMQIQQQQQHNDNSFYSAEENNNNNKISKDFNTQSKYYDALPVNSSSIEYHNIYQHDNKQTQNNNTTATTTITTPPTTIGQHYAYPLCPLISPSLHIPITQQYLQQQSYLRNLEALNKSLKSTRHNPNYNKHNNTNDSNIGTTGILSTGVQQHGQKKKNIQFSEKDSYYYSETNNNNTANLQHDYTELTTLPHPATGYTTPENIKNQNQTKKIQKSKKQKNKKQPTHQQKNNSVNNNNNNNNTGGLFITFGAQSINISHRLSTLYHYNIPNSIYNYHDIDMKVGFETILPQEHKVETLYAKSRIPSSSQQNNNNQQEQKSKIIYKQNNNNINDDGNTTVLSRNPSDADISSRRDVRKTGKNGGLPRGHRKSSSKQPTNQRSSNPHDNNHNSTIHTQHDVDSNGYKDDDDEYYDNIKYNGNGKEKIKFEVLQVKYEKTNDNQQRQQSHSSNADNIQSTDGNGSKVADVNTNTQDFKNSRPVTPQNQFFSHFLAEFDQEGITQDSNNNNKEKESKDVPNNKYDIAHIGSNKPSPQQTIYQTASQHEGNDVVIPPPTTRTTTTSIAFMTPPNQRQINIKRYQQNANTFANGHPLVPLLYFKPPAVDNKSNINTNENTNIKDDNIDENVNLNNNNNNINKKKKNNGNIYKQHNTQQNQQRGRLLNNLQEDYDLYLKQTKQRCRQMQQQNQQQINNNNKTSPNQIDINKRNVIYANGSHNGILTEESPVSEEDNTNLNDAKNNDNNIQSTNVKGDNDDDLEFGTPKTSVYNTNDNINNTNNNGDLNINYKNTNKNKTPKSTTKAHMKPLLHPKEGNILHFHQINDNNTSSSSQASPSSQHQQQPSPCIKENNKDNDEQNKNDINQEDTYNVNIEHIQVPSSTTSSTRRCSQSPSKRSKDKSILPHIQASVLYELPIASQDIITTTYNENNESTPHQQQQISSLLDTTHELQEMSSTTLSSEESPSNVSGGNNINNNNNNANATHFSAVHFYHQQHDIVKNSTIEQQLAIISITTSIPTSSQHINDVEVQGVDNKNNLSKELIPTPATAITTTTAIIANVIQDNNTNNTNNNSVNNNTSITDRSIVDMNSPQCFAAQHRKLPRAQQVQYYKSSFLPKNQLSGQTGFINNNNSNNNTPLQQTKTLQPSSINNIENTNIYIKPSTQHQQQPKTQKHETTLPQTLNQHNTNNNNNNKTVPSTPASTIESLTPIVTNNQLTHHQQGNNNITSFNIGAAELQFAASPAAVLSRTYRELRGSVLRNGPPSTRGSGSNNNNNNNNTQTLTTTTTTNNNNNNNVTFNKSKQHYNIPHGSSDDQDGVYDSNSNTDDDDDDSDTEANISSSSAYGDVDSDYHNNNNNNNNRHHKNTNQNYNHQQQHQQQQDDIYRYTPIQTTTTVYIPFWLRIIAHIINTFCVLVGFSRQYPRGNSYGSHNHSESRQEPPSLNNINNDSDDEYQQQQQDYAAWCDKSKPWYWDPNYEENDAFYRLSRLFYLLQHNYRLKIEKDKIYEKGQNNNNVNKTQQQQPQQQQNYNNDHTTTTTENNNNNINDDDDVPILLTTENQPQPTIRSQIMQEVKEYFAMRRYGRWFSFCVAYFITILPFLLVIFDFFYSWSLSIVECFFVLVMHIIDVFGRCIDHHRAHSPPAPPPQTLANGLVPPSRPPSSNHFFRHHHHHSKKQSSSKTNSRHNSTVPSRRNSIYKE